ncbi:hypothetical protein AB0D30_21815 [Streptomyces sp. NPDC048409]
MTHEITEPSPDWIIAAPGPRAGDQIGPRSTTRTPKRHPWRLTTAQRAA